MNLMEFLEPFGDKNLLNSAFCILHFFTFCILHSAFLTPILHYVLTN